MERCIVAFESLLEWDTDQRFVISIFIQQARRSKATQDQSCSAPQPNSSAHAYTSTN